MSAVLPESKAQRTGPGRRALAAVLGLFLLLSLSSTLRAQTDCLSCHADKAMQDAAGHSVGVDADTFHASIHGSLSCTDCHTSIKQYPHPDKVDAGQVRHLPCRPSNGNRRQRTCLRQRASLHQLPWRRPRHLPQDRCALRGLSAEHPTHLRQLSLQPRAGKEVRPAECLFGVHGLHPWICGQQRGIAGGGELHELPWIAPHPEPQGSTEPHVQGEHSQHLRNMPRRCDGGVHLAECMARPLRRQPGCSGMLGLPHRACHPAADAGGFPHAVHADLRHRATRTGSRPTGTPSTRNWGSLGGYVETARCWDCHGAHNVLPAIRPQLARSTPPT